MAFIPAIAVPTAVPIAVIAPAIAGINAII